MFEKVNPMHPDKIADRIAGAIVDLAYSIEDNPKIAVEVLIGHGDCTIIVETDLKHELDYKKIQKIVYRISGTTGLRIFYNQYAQDEHLSKNQSEEVKCGDNGIFRGVPVTDEQLALTIAAKHIYHRFPYDGKYISDSETGKLVICQSNCKDSVLRTDFPKANINPLGFWTGGTFVDTGATNRKLGSDMGDSVTGGGLHGKDLSKADVTLNIYAFLKAQFTSEPVEITCGIGDTEVDGHKYSDLVGLAKIYIDEIGGFEKFAEWGLIR